MSWLKRLFGSKSSHDVPHKGAAVSSGAPVAAPPKTAAAHAVVGIQSLFARGEGAVAFLEHAAGLPAAQLTELNRQILERDGDAIRPLLELRFKRDGGPRLSDKARSITVDLVDAIWKKDPDGFTALTQDADGTIRSAAVGVMSVALTLAKPNSWLKGDELERAKASYNDIVTRAIPGLTQALQDSDNDVRASALRGLGSAGDATPVEAMLPLADDQDPAIRSSWLHAFAKTSDLAVLEKIVLLSSDPAVEVRRTSPMALYEHLHHDNAAGAMKVLARDDEASVRSAVAQWVAYSDSRVAGELLEALSGDADAKVRTAVVGSLAGSYRDEQKAIFAKIVHRFWESDETADAHRAAGGSLIPHDTHAGVARLRRPRRDTSPIDVSGSFVCIGGCNKRVPFTASVPQTPNQKQPVNCSCGLTNSLDISEQGGFIWIIARPLTRPRPLNPNVLRMGITIASIRIDTATLASVKRGDEERKLWIGDPGELLPQHGDAAPSKTDMLTPTREVVLANAMKRYDDGLRNLCKSQGNKSAMWYGQAIRDFSSAIDVDPSMVEAYRQRATCFAARGDIAKAQADRERVTELETAPSYSAPANRAAAHALCRQARQGMETGGLISDALFQLQKAIDADPTCADAYDARSDVYRTLGMSDEAIADIQRAGRVKGGV
jgi:hypothetical protein